MSIYLNLLDQNYVAKKRKEYELETKGWPLKPSFEDWLRRHRR